MPGNYNSAKRVCVDIDGTICDSTEGYEDARPIQAVIDKVNHWYDNGLYIILYTARGMHTYKGNLGQINKNYAGLTIDWLKKHNVKFHEISFGKPSADYYLDDKAVNINDIDSINI